MPPTDAYSFQGIQFEVHEQATPPDSRPHLAMNVTTAGFLILSGGAILDPNTDGGCLLTAFWPVSNSEWDAAAKEHQAPGSAVMVVRCITANVPPDQLLIAQATSATAVNHPRAEAVLPPDYVLVGGGGRSNSTGAGSFLFASRPGSGESWFVAAKDHVVADPSTVTAFAIGLRRRFLDSAGVRVVRFRAQSEPAIPHPGVLSGADIDRAALVGGGAVANWTGAGSLLTACGPSGGPGGPNSWMWLARSKDHEISDPSTITAWGLALVAT